MNDPSRTLRSGGLELDPGVGVAAGGLRWSFSRSGGPGGQAVNKLSTRATLRVAIRDFHGLDESALHRLRAIAGSRLTQNDEILISADTHRSQLDNKQQCVNRLTAMIRQAMVRPKVRRKRKPTRSMIEKRLKSKRRHSEKKSLRRGGRADND